MELKDLLQSTAAFLAFAMLLIALSISASTTVKRMIRLYQMQALALGIIVLLTLAGGQSARSGSQGQPEAVLPFAAVAFLPLFLALTIRPFLRRATLASPEPREGRKASLTVRGADVIWLQHGRSQWPAVVSVVVNLVLTVIAFATTYRLLGTETRELIAAETIDVNSLAISMALLLLGISIMANKRDIIAQIMGLLVMEHGLFLAVVRIRIDPIPKLAFIFALSLFFYIIITLTILLWILPTLHRISGSIDLDAQRQLRG
jgi:hydrogenase-4 membrane subunit HyfE